MPVAFYKVPFSVEAKPGGEAELVPPESLRDLSYGVVLVQEGAMEGIVRAEGSQSALKRVEESGGVRRLDGGEVEELRKSYATPKTKRKLRMKPQPTEEDEFASDDFETDEAGNRVVETVQTVRSGFYLIDVPLVSSP
jgi:hypothetical protein